MVVAFNRDKNWILHTVNFWDIQYSIFVISLFFTTINNETHYPIKQSNVSIYFNKIELKIQF